MIDEREAAANTVAIQQGAYSTGREAEIVASSRTYTLWALQEFQTLILAEVDPEAALTAFTEEDFIAWLDS